MSGHGVYFHRDAQGECLYIGKTCNLLQRTNAHRSTAKWAKQIAYVEFIECEDSIDATQLERDSIRNSKPKYNKRHVQLPSDSEFLKMHHVVGPNKYYDGCIEFLGFINDYDLSKFLRVSVMHMQMVRAGMAIVTIQEMEFIANRICCSPYEICRLFENKRSEIAAMKARLERLDREWK